MVHRSGASPRRRGAAALLVTVVARDPQAHFSWGGNPTGLSLALGVFALGQASGRARASFAAAGLALAAAAETHAVIPLGLAYALGPSVVEA
jgi:hypothetical protein